MSVYLLATCDTKGAEAAFLAGELRRLGVNVKLVDISCGPTENAPADVSRDAVLAAAGIPPDEIESLKRAERGRAVTAMAQGASALVADLHRQGKVAGVLGIGGSAGTTIATAAMQALPLGVPKLMVSTLASGQVRHYVGSKDILMLNPVVDILGVNRVSRIVLGTAARAMAGMVTLQSETVSESDKPLVAATMFGVTTPCVEQAREALEQAGYEVLVFHATGAGGQAMESLVADGLFAGVLDITTTELADELVGGVLSAGPERLTAAARAGVPQVVSVGATDMVNFHARDSVPEKFADRKFHQHNANVTLMRTTPDENARLGAEIGRKLQLGSGGRAILLPGKGVSAIDREGGPFDDPQARRQLFAALRAEAGDVEVVEMDHHINDPEFAAAAAQKLIELMEK